MQNSLTKYKIGFGILGIFTLVLAVMVVTQGAATKQDTATYNRAQKVADSLQNSITIKGSIPSSLKAAGITSSTDNISYTKINDSLYKFCVTYKTNTSFDASSITNQLYTGGLSSDGTYSSSSESAYLYVDYTHKKGENCKTIKPTLYSPYSSNKYDPYGSGFNSGTGSSSTSTPGTYTSPSQAAQDACDKQYPDVSQTKEYFACLDKASGSTAAPNTKSTSGRIRTRPN